MTVYYLVFIVYFIILKDSSPKDGNLLYILIFRSSEIRMGLFLHQVCRKQWMLCSEWVPSE